MGGELSTTGVASDNQGDQASFFVSVQHTFLNMPHIQYSEKYYDDVFEYRHVILPSDIAKHLPKNRLLSETEWRDLGVQQSRGWVHYAIHRPEPHIMLFRRAKGYGTAAEVKIPNVGGQSIKA